MLVAERFQQAGFAVIQSRYFNDPEEVQSFVLQMAWDLIQGKDKKEVIDKIKPIVQGHFKDEAKFKEIFKEMIIKAINLQQIFAKGGEFTI